MDRIAVVGASLAGLRAAQTLRRDGFAGALTVIGREPQRPYDRPPLSKQVLAGEWDPSRTALVDEADWAALDLDEHLGVEAVGLDLDRRQVLLGNGDHVGFDGLIVATGARPRELPGPLPAGVHTLRTLPDALAILAALDAAEHVVVVGAGFIGAEVAATCRGRGLEVTLVEAADVPLVRGLGEDMGRRMAELHRAHGVDLRLGTAVEAVTGDNRVESVVFTDGAEVPADLVVVGIGVVPDVAWLEGSGLHLDDGVVCDETLLAAPGVVAAGDVARWPNRLFGEVMRVEHWHNATEQGAAAGRRLIVPDAEAVAFTPVPWFWSDQYDRKIQVTGRTNEADEVRVVVDSPAEGRIVALYRRGDRLAGAFGMNRPRHIAMLQTALAEGVDFEAAIEITTR